MFRKIYPDIFILETRSKSRLDQRLDQILITYYLSHFFLNLSIFITTSAVVFYMQSLNYYFIIYY